MSDDAPIASAADNVRSSRRSRLTGAGRNLEANAADGGQGIDRRSLLAAAGVTAGVAWITPAILSVDAAAAASALATVVAGTFVHVQGNAATFRSQDMPVGTFTTLVLVVGITGNNTGSTGPTSLQPIAVDISTPGWTRLVGIEDGNAPGFAVFSAGPGAPPPAVAAQNLTNGRLTAVVLGWSSGTTVTASAIGSAATPGTSTALTVPAATASTPSTWVFAGSASDGFSGSNWATLPAGAWSPIVVADISGNNNTPPDMYVVRNLVLQSSIASLTETFFVTGSTGSNFGARGVFVGVG